MVALCRMLLTFKFSRVARYDTHIKVRVTINIYLEWLVTAIDGVKLSLLKDSPHAQPLQDLGHVGISLKTKKKCGDKNVCRII